MEKPREFSPEIKLNLYIDKMKIDLADLAEDCFSSDKDPEVSWRLFREQLKHYKDKHVLLYMNTDAE